MLGLERMKQDALMGPPKEIFDEENYLKQEAKRRNYLKNKKK